ncbi:hypothetical protein ACFY0N_37300 [Streptomyces vinaceus]|uniref:hypothetical protein n=1 Tax=Streptomyces vinaceus TaxID=1960 RepID=UPI0035DDB5CF
MSTSAPGPLLTYRLSRAPKAFSGGAKPDTDGFSLTIGEGLVRDVRAYNISIAVPVGPCDLVRDPDHVDRETTGGSAPSQRLGWDVERYTNAAGTHEVFVWTPRRDFATFNGTWSLTLSVTFAPNPDARSVDLAIQETSSSADSEHGRVRFQLTVSADDEPVIKPLESRDIFEA